MRPKIRAIIRFASITGNDLILFVKNNIIYTFKVRAVRNIKTASTKRGFYMKFRNALLILIVLLAGALFAAGLASFSSQVYAGSGSDRRVSLGIELPDVPIRTKTPSPVPGKDPTPSTSPNKTSAPTPSPSPDKTNAPTPSPSPSKTSTLSPSPTPVTTAAPTESVPATAHTDVPATAQTTDAPSAVPAVTSSAAPTATNTPNAVITLPLDDFETALPSPDTTDSIAATVSATGNTSATDNASATDNVSASDNASATVNVSASDNTSATDNASATDSASVPATGEANVTPVVPGEKVNQKGSVPVWGIVFSAAGIICIIASFILLLINRSKRKKY